MVVDWERVKALYLGWLDDNPKKAVETKILEGINAYVERFQTMPNVVLMSEADLNALTQVVNGVQPRKESYIRKNNFWFGIEAVNTLR